MSNFSSIPQRGDWGKFGGLRGGKGESRRKAPCFNGGLGVYLCMDVIVEFNEAAFRHDISREDILHALNTKLYAAVIEGLPEKYGVIGLDRAGNPLEVMYNPIDDNTISVFHAMKARKSFMKMLGLEE
jgi:hypothetical protein